MKNANVVSIHHDDSTPTTHPTGARHRPEHKRQPALDSALERDGWNQLYADIGNRETAQAVLEAAKHLPLLQQRYPTLLIRAQEALIRHRGRTLCGWWAYGTGRLLGSVICGLLSGIRVSRHRRQEKVALAKRTGVQGFSVRAQAGIARNSKPVPVESIFAGR
ncbi:hypothetical protein [Ralstonia sp.]|uniref:hypothetical protein n=1 Tax=Ralstonia sp. TaxID=54061 RepID=UPI0031E45058